MWDNKTDVESDQTEDVSTNRFFFPGNFGFAITISVCRLRERGCMYKSVHVCVVHDLRYVLCCAIERQL